MSAPESTQPSENEQFDAYFRQTFPGHVPVVQQSASHLAAEANTYPAPSDPNRSAPDADPDTHVGPRTTESDEMLEEQAVAAYVRQRFPGTTL
jgi:hypothetical protein